jgi:predicted ATPase
VGGHGENEQMTHALDLSRQGHGQIVAAMGEPGVGKSRLFYEFKSISLSGCAVLETFSVSHGKASAYLPLIDLLKNYFKIAPEDDERARREKVIGKVLALDRTLEDALPYLFSLAGVAGEDDLLAQDDAQIKRRRTQEAVKRIILRESLNQALVLIVEDLHWIDAETQAVMNLLVDSIANARVLLLVNYRPEYRHDWGSRTCYTQLRLDPLGRESADEMLSALFDIGPPLPDQPGSGSPLPDRGADRSALPLPDQGEGRGVGIKALKSLIIERTEGNPFFMEEIVQGLFEQGTLARNGAVHLTRRLRPCVWASWCMRFLHVSWSTSSPAATS